MNQTLGLLFGAGLIIASRVIPGLDDLARWWLFVPGAALIVLVFLSAL